MREKLLQPRFQKVIQKEKFEILSRCYIPNGDKFSIGNILFEKDNKNVRLTIRIPCYEEAILLVEYASIASALKELGNASF